MNRIIRNAVLSLGLAGVLSAAAIVPSRMAFADTGDTGAPQGHGHHHGERQGLLGAALKLGSISPDQRAAIEQLIARERTARAPIRQADAQVLVALAQQVEQASIDPQGLAPTLNVEKGAVASAVPVEQSALNRLHALLTSAQRAELVDAMESHFGRHGHGGDAGAGGEHGWREGAHDLGLSPQQRATIRANFKADGGVGQARGHMHALLEAFRGDSFDAATFVTGFAPGEMAERMAQAMVPVLTPAQRATFAGHLRARASHLGG
jgi:Spy/CpxP family protein refolding chaperone